MMNPLAPQLRPTLSSILIALSTGNSEEVINYNNNYTCSKSSKQITKYAKLIKQPSNNTNCRQISTKELDSNAKTFIMSLIKDEDAIDIDDSDGLLSEFKRNFIKSDLCLYKYAQKHKDEL